MEKAEFEDKVGQRYVAMQRSKTTKDQLLDMIKSDVRAVVTLTGSQDVYRGLGIVLDPDNTSVPPFLINISAAALRLNDMLKPAPGEQIGLELFEGDSPMMIMQKQDAPVKEKPATVGKAFEMAFGGKGKVGNNKKNVGVGPVAAAPAPVEKAKPQAPAIEEKKNERTPGRIEKALASVSDEYERDSNGYLVCEPCQCLSRTDATTHALDDERRVFITKENIKGIVEGYYFASAKCNHCQGTGFEPRRKDKFMIKKKE
jgi:hypothetical protein